MPDLDNESHQPSSEPERERVAAQLVTVESQREFDLLSGRRSERTFLKLYVEARTSGLLSEISDRDWKTLCTLATYMDADGFCFPSQAELARSLGCSRQMANERIKSLARFRFQGNPVVLVEKDGRTEQGTWSRNGYRILPIANLGIFDDAEKRPVDRRKQTRPKWAPDAEKATDPAMSRSLDMGAVTRTLDTVPAPTVSSGTVPVGLDTNKNQLTNEISLSNIRKASATDQRQDLRTEKIPETPTRGRGTPQAVGETLAQRQVGRSRVRVEADPDRDIILEYVADFSREFSDRASLKSSTTRAYNLYQASELPLETFLEGMYRARAVTKERSGSIRGSKFAYFISILEDLLGLRDDPPLATE